MIGKFVAKCCDDNCVPFENPIPVTSLAQAYVPMQMWTEPMEAMTSLACGTVFGELVMPYVKGSSLERNKREVCNHES